MDKKQSMMNILSDRDISSLFKKLIFVLIVFNVTALFILFSTKSNTFLFIIADYLVMGLLMIYLVYKHFVKQDKIINNAINQIQSYINGNQNARIDCNYEGSIYRLFHEINSIVSILNANAENEEKSKVFLKNTISDISHQLKTPIASLNIYNGIIQGEADGLDTVQEFSNLSEKELDRIENLVQNLLKITKLDAGTLAFEKNPENLSDIMYSIENDFSYRAKSENKSLTFTGDDMEILCDKSWIIEALENIIKNSFDHTKSGNSINVEWRKLPTIIQIVIKDNGSGIHPEDLHHIFKRFYRSRFSKDTQGIGLGLPLAKSIIEEHNGTIEVDSSLGHYTKFTINFSIPTKL